MVYFLKKSNCLKLYWSLNLVNVMLQVFNVLQSVETANFKNLITTKNFNTFSNEHLKI